MKKITLLVLFMVTSFLCSAQSVFINEIHYDNASTDVGEFIEIAGPAGTDLSGWQLELYNGSNGTVYDTEALTGTIPDEGAGFGALSFPITGIQNGAPDGVALINGSSAVVQFLSYEGSFMATAGTANGMTSTDIGVEEGSGTAVGESMQLQGTGNTYSDFTWASDLAESPGAINAGQTFNGANAPVTECATDTPKPIPASGPFGPMDPSPINVTETGVIGTAAGEYTIESVSLELNHTFDGDLDITLLSPDGTTLFLSDSNGGAGDNYTGTIFMDGGADINAASAPFTGTFEPEGGTFESTFAGENVGGNWTLNILDNNSGDNGTLLDWCITVSQNPISPIIACPSDVVANTDPGVCGAVVNFADAVAVDPEGGPVTVTQTMGDPSGSVFPPGVTIIEFTATDQDGDSSTCQFTITITDNEDPTITCGAAITQTNDPGMCGADIVVPPAMPMDNCPVSGPGSGTLVNDYNGTDDASDFYPVGTTTVTWTYTDAEGNSVDCTQDITVTDDEAPVIVCQGEQAVPPLVASAAPGTPITDNATFSETLTVAEDFTITDLNVDMDITHTWTGDVTITLESPAGTIVTVFDDIDGCSANDITTLFDDESANALDCDPGGAGSGGDAFPEDDYIPSNPLDAFDGESTMGDWILTIEDDAFGDTGTLNAFALIFDFPPVVTPPLDVVLDANGMATIPASDLIVSASDNCGPVTVTAGTGGGGGTFDETITITDPNLMASNDFNFATMAAGAMDGTLEISTFGDIDGTGGNLEQWDILDEDGNLLGSIGATGDFADQCNTTLMASIPVTGAQIDAWAADGSIDFTGIDSAGNINTTLCGGDFLEINLVFDFGPSTMISFDCSQLGENMVDVTVTDASGNETMCVATVNVIDDTAPVLVCQDVTIELGEDGTAEVDPAALLAETDGVYNVMVIGSDNASGTEGFTDFTVAVTDATTVSFDWDYTTNDGAGFDSFGYLLNGTYTQLTDDALGNQSGSASVAVAPGDVFGFRSQTDDNTFGNNETVISNFLPGFDGQFAQANWNLSATNSDGDAFFVEVIPPGPLSFDACGITVLAVDVTEVTCADIGAPITAMVFASDASGNIAACTSMITVVDNLAPVLTCPADQTVDPGEGNLFYEVPDYFATGEATATDNCTDPVVLTTQDPAAGDLIGDGTYTVTLTAEDEYGNLATCTFELTVESILGVEDNALNTAIVMYPNPATNQVTIANSSNVLLDSAVIYDVNGKLISTTDLSNMQGERSIDVSALASGVYMVQITSQDASVVKRLIIE